MITSINTPISEPEQTDNHNWKTMIIHFKRSLAKEVPIVPPGGVSLSCVCSHSAARLGRWSPLTGTGGLSNLARGLLFRHIRQLPRQTPGEIVHARYLSAEPPPGGHWPLAVGPQGEVAGRRLLTVDLSLDGRPGLGGRRLGLGGRRFRGRWQSRRWTAERLRLTCHRRPNSEQLPRGFGRTRADRRIFGSRPPSPGALQRHLEALRVVGEGEAESVDRLLPRLSAAVVASLL